MDQSVPQSVHFIQTFLHHSMTDPSTNRSFCISYPRSFGHGWLVPYDFTITALLYNTKKKSERVNYEVMDVHMGSWLQGGPAHFVAQGQALWPSGSGLLPESFPWLCSSNFVAGAQISSGVEEASKSECVHSVFDFDGQWSCYSMVQHGKCWRECCSFVLFGYYQIHDLVQNLIN